MRDADAGPYLTGGIEHQQREAVRDADHDAEVLEETLAARQSRRLDKEILERDGKHDQRNAAGAGENPLVEGVRHVQQTIAAAIIQLAHFSHDR